MSQHSEQPKPLMLYFGPWDRAGHYFHDETGCTGHVYSPRGQSVIALEKSLPWSPGDIDGGLQPHFADCRKKLGSSYCDCGRGPVGLAILHQKDGWTALSFWDRSVDERGGCNSNYFANGIFSFAEMVQMAKTRFAYRWNKMNFEVTEAESNFEAVA